MKKTLDTHWHKPVAPEPTYTSSLNMAALFLVMAQQKASTDNPVTLAASWGPRSMTQRERVDYIVKLVAVEICLQKPEGGAS